MYYVSKHRCKYVKCLYVSYSKRSDREVRGAGQVLQLVWAHKELRRPLEKDGWKKTDFMVNLNPNGSTTNGPSTRANGTYEDSTTPLLDRGQCARSNIWLDIFWLCLNRQKRFSTNEDAHFVLYQKLLVAHLLGV